jgi:hypothetical protein
MSRGPHNFPSKADVTKAVNAAVKSGAKDWIVEIEKGKIVIRAGDERRDYPAVERDPEWE